MKKLLVVSGLVLAVFIAAISETSAQTIYSCINKTSGAMRYVTGPDKCKKTETQISWNTTGATGPQGPPGAAGATNGITTAVFGTCFLTGERGSTQQGGDGFFITGPYISQTAATYQIMLSMTAFSGPNDMPHCVVSPVSTQSPTPLILSLSHSVTYEMPCCMDLVPLQWVLSVDISSYDPQSQVWSPVVTDFSFICVR